MKTNLIDVLTGEEIVGVAQGKLANGSWGKIYVVANGRRVDPICVREKR
jgi:thiamine phosphate synthase YjbQ (UPF0047 family)